MRLLLVEPAIADATLPIVNLLLGLVSGQAIAFLYFARQLFAAAGDDVDIVVTQLVLLFFDLALDLLPVSFGVIPIHVFPLQIIF